MKAVKVSRPRKGVRASRYFDELVVPRCSTRVKVPIRCYDDTGPIRHTADARNRSRRKNNQGMLCLAHRSNDYCTDPGSMCRRAIRLGSTLAYVTYRVRNEIMLSSDISKNYTLPGSPVSSTTVITAGSNDDDNTVSVHVIDDS